MGNPVVVQGRPVSRPQQAQAQQPQQSYGGEEGGRPQRPPQDPPQQGEKQETRCRDIPFLILFYINLFAMVAVAVIYGPDALSADDSENNNADGGGADNTGDNREYDGYVYAALICAVLSVLGSIVGMSIMMCIPETLIKVALILVVVLAFVWMVVSFLSGSIFGAIIGLIIFAITLCYARACWPRIPFATANLVTAMTAVRTNWGVITYAFILTALAGVWSIVWSLAFVGVFDRTYECSDESNTCTDVNYGFLFLLFVSYFFTHQVIQNTVHVTVGGLVGNWWFEPSEASSCCSSALNNSFLRAVTTSFGSICFGSLLVAILDALRLLANTARGMDDGGIGACIAECILECLARLLEYFNKWAFIYVGLYGYSYLEAGKNVFTLFQNRGWEAIIADDLVNNVLLLVSVVVGGVIGALAIAIEATSDLFEDAGGNSKAVAFVLGFVIGLVVCSVALSTIGSGVNAVVVLFAEAPAEFQQNHPQLSERMRSAWSRVYPGSV